MHPKKSPVPENSPTARDPNLTLGTGLFGIGANISLDKTLGKVKPNLANSDEESPEELDFRKFRVVLIAKLGLG
jgi:hypothetical protein